MSTATHTYSHCPPPPPERHTHTPSFTLHFTFFHLLVSASLGWRHKSLHLFLFLILWHSCCCFCCCCHSCFSHNKLTTWFTPIHTHTPESEPPSLSHPITTPSIDPFHWPIPLKHGFSTLAHPWPEWPFRLLLLLCFRFALTAADASTAQSLRGTFHERFHLFHYLPHSDETLLWECWWKFTVQITPAHHTHLSGHKIVRPQLALWHRSLTNDFWSWQCVWGRMQAHTHTLTPNRLAVRLSLAIDCVAESASSLSFSFSIESCWCALLHLPFLNHHHSENVRSWLMPLVGLFRCRSWWCCSPLL